MGWAAWASEQGWVKVDPLRKLREKTAYWKFKYSGSEDGWGRATELTFPHSHFIDRKM